MFGATLRTRQRERERVADQAWRYLLSVVNSASDSLLDGTRDTARSAERGTRYLAGETSERMGYATEEAKRRATLAFDALAGRQAPRPWPWIASAAAAGALIGWAASSAARSVAVSHADKQRLAEIEFVELDQPEAPASGSDLM